MDRAYSGMIYLSYWNEKASCRMGNTLFFQMQYHSPSRLYSFIQMRNLSLINDKPVFTHWPWTSQFLAISISMAFRLPLNNFEWYLYLIQMEFHLLAGVILLFLTKFVTNWIEFSQSGSETTFKSWSVLFTNLHFFQETNLATIHSVLRCFLTRAPKCSELFISGPYQLD